MPHRLPWENRSNEMIFQTREVDLRGPGLSKGSGTVFPCVFFVPGAGWHISMRGERIKAEGLPFSVRERRMESLRRALMPPTETANGSGRRTALFERRLECFSGEGYIKESPEHGNSRERSDCCKIIHDTRGKGRGSYVPYKTPVFLKASRNKEDCSVWAAAFCAGNKTLTR